MHLIRPNDFICEDNWIPGLKRLELEDNRLVSTLKSPSLISTSTLVVSSITVNIPQSLESKLLSQLEDRRIISQGNFRDINKQISITKRVISVGMHNGCTFVKPPVEASLILSNTKLGDVLTFEGSLAFSSFINHRMCVLVMELQYSSMCAVQLTVKLTWIQTNP